METHELTWEIERDARGRITNIVCYDDLGRIVLDIAASDDAMDNPGLVALAALLETA